MSTPLHPTRTVTALVPKYVTRFACIGPECEDTCCAEWRVTIDKKTFNAYRQTKHPDVAQPLHDNLKRQRSQTGDASYGRIEMAPRTGLCPMVQDKLCGVQKALGESYLSDTCFVYPRYNRQFGGQYEQSLTLSCPQAAREALLSADAFDFVTEKMHVRASTVSDIKPKWGLSVQVMDEIRIFCLQLMRTQDLDLWQRLAVLGVFCERLTNLLASAGHAQVPDLINGFTQMVETGAVLQALDGMAPNHAAQAKVFSFFWCSKVKPSVSPLQNQVMAAVARGFGAQDGNGVVSTDEVVRRYVYGVGRLPQALADTPHLLENYVLNEMFRDLFPFGRSTAYEHYLQLVSRFGLIRLILAAQCTQEGELPSVDRIINTVHVFCRRFQHDLAFTTQVNKALSDASLDKLESVYGFLRA